MYIPTQESDKYTDTNTYRTSFLIGQLSFYSDLSGSLISIIKCRHVSNSFYGKLLSLPTFVRPKRRTNPTKIHEYICLYI